MHNQGETKENKVHFFLKCANDTRKYTHLPSRFQLSEGGFGWRELSARRELGEYDRGKEKLREHITGYRTDCERSHKIE